MTFPRNSFLYKYYSKQLATFSDGLFFLVISLIFSDLLNVLISGPPMSQTEGTISPIGRSRRSLSSEENPKKYPKSLNSSETAASSQKGMMGNQDLSDDENAIEIKDFQSIPSNQDKSHIKQESPKKLFTVKEMRTVGEMGNIPSVLLNSHQPVQLPRRNSNVFFNPTRIANTKLTLCLFSFVFILLVLSKLSQIGVLSALFLGLFLRVCLRSCNEFLIECSPIEWFDRKLGDRNVCGFGFFPSPRLAAKRRMEKEKLYQKICAQERQTVDTHQDESVIDQSSVGYVSMQIDRNALYQRYLFFEILLFLL